LGLLHLTGKPFCKKVTGQKLKNKLKTTLLVTILLINTIVTVDLILTKGSFKSLTQFLIKMSLRFDDETPSLLALASMGGEA
jgi:hypothetical protein